MRIRGINYDTGFFPGGKVSRASFDAVTVGRELQIIATDLHCNAVRVSGGDLERLAAAGRATVDAGMEVWLSPFPAELGGDELRRYLREAAELAEALRSGSRRVLLIAGCELSVFATGFLPGATAYDRMRALSSPDPAFWESMADAPARLNAFLGDIAQDVRARFGGAITYASASWEPIDWSPFDWVAVDAYRDSSNASTYQSELRRLAGLGKPLAVTEFGCCTYRGASARGAMGWAVVDENTEPPRLKDALDRDEVEQVRYMDDVLSVFEDVGVDAGFWFTFAGYRLPHRAEPRFDLDLASFGVVKILDGATGTRYPEMAWEPKASFDALAARYRQMSAPSIDRSSTVR
jgi:hypothetical protein